MRKRERQRETERDRERGREKGRQRGEGRWRKRNKGTKRNGVARKMEHQAGGGGERDR